MIETIQELVIIGGGVMGLCTAYAASPFTGKITILEKSRIGDPKTASFGYTRSIRSDYLTRITRDWRMKRAGSGSTSSSARRNRSSSTVAA